MKVIPTYITITFLILLISSSLVNAIVINDYSNHNVQLNSLNLLCKQPSDVIKDLVHNVDNITPNYFRLESDGVILESEIDRLPWFELLAGPHEYMDISNKALLVKYSIRSYDYQQPYLNVDVYHRNQQEGSQFSCPKRHSVQLQYQTGEVIIPFDDSTYHLGIKESYQLVQSIALYTHYSGVRIEYVELVPYSAEDKERFEWGELYLASKQYRIDHQLFEFGSAQILRNAYTKVMSMNFDLNRDMKVKFTGRYAHRSTDHTARFYSLISQAIFEPKNGYFINSGNTLHINPLESTFKHDGSMPFIYQFIGRVFGLALKSNNVIDGDLSITVLKLILFIDISINDVATFDPDCYEQLRAIVEHDYSLTDSSKPHRIGRLLPAWA